MDIQELERTGVRVEQGEDGSLTLSFGVLFDPEVKAEMAKAIPTGMERDDLSDKIEEAEDEAPKGAFATALDSLLGNNGLTDAEDARPIRHGKTPLDSCRAKDPRFCPYHGDAAIKDYLIGSIVRSVALSRPSFSRDDLTNVDVDVKKEGGGYSVSIRDSSGDNNIGNAVVYAISDLSNTNGLSLTFPKAPIGQAPGSHTWVADVKTGRGDAFENLQEYVDDLVVDLDDQRTKDVVPPSSVVSLFQKISDTKEARDAAEANPNDALLAKAAKDKMEESLKQYRVVRSLVDFKDVGTVGVFNAIASKTESAVDSAKKDFAGRKARIDALKAAFWKNGKFPHGFAKANGFADDYNKAVQKAGHWTASDYDKASNEYLIGLKGGRRLPFSPTAELDPSDRERYIPYLANLQRTGEMYADACSDYNIAADKFERDLYDYVTGIDPKTNQPRFPKETVDAAFGQFAGSAQATTTKKTYTAPVAGAYDVSNNNLTDLNQMPLFVGGDFLCFSNNLTSLEGAPSYVGGDFWCSDNNLTSLEGAPSSVGGDFWCFDNNLTSLKGAPSSVGGSVNLKGCNLTEEQIQAYMDYLKNPDPAHTDATGHYIENPN